MLSRLYTALIWVQRYGLIPILPNISHIILKRSYFAILCLQFQPLAKSFDSLLRTFIPSKPPLFLLHTYNNEAKTCVIKVIRSRVSLRIFDWEGDFMLIININIFIFYYADFRTPNCLMTLVTHDTHDIPFEKNKKIWVSIREPQWPCRTFAVS